VEVLEQELTKRLEEAGGSSQELETLRKRLTDVDQERRLLEDRLDNAKARITKVSIFTMPGAKPRPDSPPFFLIIEHEIPFALISKRFLPWIELWVLFLSQ
jgi:hypothetical protein